MMMIAMEIVVFLAREKRRRVKGNFSTVRGSSAHTHTHTLRTLVRTMKNAFHFFPLPPISFRAAAARATTERKAGKKSLRMFFLVQFPWLFFSSFSCSLLLCFDGSEHVNFPSDHFLSHMRVYAKSIYFLSSPTHSFHHPVLTSTRKIRNSLDSLPLTQRPFIHPSSSSTAHHLASLFFVVCFSAYIREILVQVFIVWRCFAYTRTEKFFSFFFLLAPPCVRALHILDSLPPPLHRAVSVVVVVVDAVESSVKWKKFRCAPYAHIYRRKIFALGKWISSRFFFCSSAFLFVYTQWVEI